MLQIIAHPLPAILSLDHTAPISIQITKGSPLISYSNGSLCHSGLESARAYAYSLWIVVQNCWRVQISQIWQFCTYCDLFEAGALYYSGAEFVVGSISHQQ